MTIPYGSEFVVVHTLVVTHRAFVKAGPAAVGFWTGALAYTRRERLNGWIPKEGLAVILGVGAKEAKRLAELLVAAELFARDEKRGGYVVLRYAEMGNETSEEIDSRLTKAKEERTRERDRKAALRAASRQTDGTFGPRSTARPPTVPPDVPPDNRRTDAGQPPGQPPAGATPVQPQTEQSRADHIKYPPLSPQGGVEMSEPEQAEDRRERVARFASSERTYWTSVYAREVEAVTGIRPWTFPRTQTDLLTLSDLIAGHCEDLDTVAVCEWISRTVRAFAQDVLADKKDALYWSNYGPKGLLRWHNESRSLPRSKRPALLRPQVAELAPWAELSTEDAAAAVAASHAALARIGGAHG